MCYLTFKSGLEGKSPFHRGSWKVLLRVLNTESVNILQGIGSWSSLEVKLLNLIFVFKKPNKYCNREKQPSIRSPVIERESLEK